LHNLPAQTTPFVGREDELADLARLLDQPDNRLVTIFAPGGMGKTRLAIEVAAAQAASYRHGVHFVPLAPLSDPEMVIPAIAEAVGFPFQSDRRSPKQQLLDYFREKQLLLVLDNFEHLPETVNLVSELLQTAPQVRILATSREQLRLSGETVFTLTGLEAPDLETDRETDYAAVRLFVQSARQLQPGFTPQATDWASIGQICRLIGGMPLGILLAAGWIEMLTPEEIAAEISHSLDFLESDLRDLPERQRSLRAMCEQTWTRLTEGEQDTFRRLSVFRGGFTRGAAQAVTGASLRTLTGLVKKSLLQQTSTGRYDLHEFLRQFSAEKLEADSQAREATQDAHRDYYLAFLQEREAALSGEQQQTALAEISAEIKNVRVGWDRAVEQGNIDQIEQSLQGLYRFYWMRSQFDEGLHAFRAAAEHLQIDPVPAESQPVLGRLLARRGAFDVRLSNFDSAKTLLQESLAGARQLNSQADIAFALNRLADLSLWQSDARRAKSLGQEALAISQAIEDQDEILWALLHLSESAQEMGNYIEADRLAQEGLALSRQRKDQIHIAYCLDRLGWISHLVRDHVSSRQYYEASLAIFRELGNLRGVGLALAGLMFPHWAEGGAGLAEAKSFSQKAEAIFREIGDRAGMVINLAIQSLIANDQGQYREARGKASQALALAKELPNQYSWINGLSSLGRAECGLGNFQAAREHLREALTAQYDNLRAIIHAAYLLAKEGAAANLEASFSHSKQAYAFQLLTLVLHEPSIGQIEKNLATPLLSQLEVELPPDVVAAAKVRGQAQDLQEAITELLEALAKPNWVPSAPTSPRFVD
jgi:predicted ATPase